MSEVALIKHEIIELLLRNYGERIANYFENAYGEEIFGIFLHQAFLVLKDLVGKEKAKAEIDRILNKYKIYLYSTYE